MILRASIVFVKCFSCHSERIVEQGARNLKPSAGTCIRLGQRISAEGMDSAPRPGRVFAGITMALFRPHKGMKMVAGFLAVILANAGIHLRRAHPGFRRSPE